MAGKPRGGSNYVAEWFGHRVYPTVTKAPQALADMQAKRCPFLTDIVGVSTECVKKPESRGVCTVSSLDPAGARRDWLVCPIRALDRPLLDNVTRRFFALAPTAKILIEPAPSLASASVRK